MPFGAATTTAPHPNQEIIGLVDLQNSWSGSRGLALDWRPPPPGLECRMPRLPSWSAVLEAPPFNLS